MKIMRPILGKSKKKLNASNFKEIVHTVSKPQRKGKINSPSINKAINPPDGESFVRYLMSIE